MSEFKHFLMSTEKQLPKDVKMHIYAMYLISEYGKDLINYLCLVGNLEMLVYISFMNGDPVATFETRNVEIAAENGHLNIVRWFSEAVPFVKFSTNVMDLAAQEGHLDVVKWLHENRTEGCSIYAIQGALERGHFDVVNWLHLNRKESVSSSFIDDAIFNGKLHIVKWINENIPNVKFNYDIIEKILYDGYLEIPKYLAENSKNLNLRKTLKRLVKIVEELNIYKQTGHINAWV